MKAGVARQSATKLEAAGRAQERTATAGGGGGRGARWAAAVFVAAVTGAVFARALENDFVYDDRPLVVQNPLVRDPEHLETLLTRAYYPHLPYYRPVGSASYVLDYALWGPNPRGFHLTNVIAHVAAALVVLGLLAKVQALPRGAPGGRWIGPAVLAALLFAVHPIASSAVVPVTAREAVFCLLFGALALRLHLRGGAMGYAGSVLCTAAAVFSKEPAVVLPVILLAGDVLLCRRGWRRIVATQVALWAVVGVYFILRETVLATSAKVEGIRPLLIAQSYLYLLQTVVWPSRALVYEPTFGAWFSWWRTIAAVAVLGAVVVAVLRGRDAGRMRRAGFWAVWTVLTFLPAANIAVQETQFDERYLYLPLVGCVGLVVVALERAWRRPVAARAVIAAGLAAAGALGWASQARIAAWRNDETFSAAWVAGSPQSEKAWNYRGMILAGSGRNEEAIACYERALAIREDFDQAHNNLGNALYRANRVEEAIRHLSRAVAINPAYGAAHANLGTYLFEAGRREEGLAHLRRAVELEPLDGRTWYLLARGLLLTGQEAEGVAALERSLELDPLSAEAHYVMGLVLARRGDRAGAAAEFRRALELKPGFRPAREALKSVVQGGGR